MGTARRARFADDSGMALFTVLTISVVLFIMVTALLAVTSFQTDQVHRQAKRTEAVSIADAGLNAYLYELRRDPTFYTTSPTLGPTQLDGGTWSVTAQPPTTPSGPITLRATGVSASSSQARTVLASVRFPTFADYTFLTNSDINIGAGALIKGKLRSNGNISNAGHVTGAVLAHGTVTKTGSGVFDVTPQANAPTIDFAQVSTDMEAIRAEAIAAGTYFGASGGSGYRITMSGTSVRVDKVTGGTSTGNLTTANVITKPIPSSGVFFFDDVVYMSGTYNAMVTIASMRDIYVIDSVKPVSGGKPYTMGIVAKSNVIVPTWYPSVPNDMTIVAAMLAQTGSVYGDLRSGTVKNSITIQGSMAYSTYGYFASGTPATQGFKTRTYEYDPRLDVYPPPHYPVVRDGSLKVATWIEQ